MFYKKKESIDKAEIFFIDMLHKHIVSFEPTNSPSIKNLQGKQVLVELKLIGIDKANIWQVALDVIEELPNENKIYYTSSKLPHTSSRLPR